VFTKTSVVRCASIKSAAAINLRPDLIRHHGFRAANRQFIVTSILRDVPYQQWRNADCPFVQTTVPTKPRHLLDRFLRRGQTAMRCTGAFARLAPFHAQRQV